MIERSRSSRLDIVDAGLLKVTPHTGFYAMETAMGELHHKRHRELDGNLHRDSADL
jgi:hypothetical protein